MKNARARKPEYVRPLLLALFFVLFAVVFARQMTTVDAGSRAAPRPATSRDLVPGGLDTSFDTDGKVISSIANSNDTASDVAVQSDGKIVVAGHSSDNNVLGFTVVRYNTDGSLDTGFGGDGKVFTTVVNGDQASAVAIQADGKVVVAGKTNTGNDNAAVVRYNSDGTLDTNFNTVGKVVTTFGASAVINDVAIQSDGKIVAAGFVNLSGNLDLMVLRYNSDGSLDTGFDGDGKVSTDFGVTDIANSVVIQPNGRIVVAGSTSAGNGDFALARYNADGSLDITFDGDGKLSTSLTTSSDSALDLAVQSDGRIVAAGNDGFANGNAHIVRYNSDGTLDTSFDSDGKALVDFGGFERPNGGVAIQPDGRLMLSGTLTPNSTTFDGVVWAARLNSDGALDTTFDVDGKLQSGVRGTDGVSVQGMAFHSDKLIVGGTVKLNNVGDLALIRFNTNGTLDGGFDLDGKLWTSIHTGFDDAQDVAVQTDGKIVVTGRAANALNDFDLAVARYNSDGTLDQTFGSGGVTITPAPSNLNSAGNAITLLSTGKILIAGVSGSDFVVVKFNVDGTVDTTFGNSGRIVADFGSGEVATSLVVQADGKIVAAGHTGFGSTFDFALARWMPEGSPDVTFDGDGELTTTFANDDRADAIELQTDGKIVAAGASQGNFALARYNSNGSLDTTFDTDGKVTTAFTSGSARSMAIQSDGKIVVAGSAFNGSQSDFTLVRYNMDGSLDTGFDSDGKVTTSFSATKHDSAGDIQIRSDGRIVAGGYVDRAASPIEFHGDFAIARYNSDGSLDTTFDTDGMVETAFNVHEIGNAIEIQGDGRVVAVGTTADGVSSKSSIALARYLDIGTPPTITDIGNQTIDQDASTGALAITVGDAETSAGSLLMSGTSSNAALVPNSNIVFGGSGTSRTVTVTPAPGINGTTTITIMVTDTDGISSSDTFVLTVSPPPIVTIDDVLIVEGNSGTSSMTFTVWLSTASLQSVTVSYSTTDGTAFAGTDYVAIPSTPLTFDPMQTSKTVSVTINGDTSPEGNETLTLNLSGASGAIIGDSSGTGTITNDDSCTAVSASAGLTAHRTTTLVVPITVGDTTGSGIISYDFTLGFDPTVITAATVSFDQTGTISNNFTISANAATAGQIVVSGFGTAPLTGAGTLLKLRFNVVGMAASTSGLNFSAFGFNEGTPCAATSNGDIEVIPGSIAGTVTYGTSSSTVNVGGAMINGAGTPNVSTTTAANGAYTLNGFGSGAYTVTSSRTGDVNGITSFDAAQVAQHVTGIATLNANRQAAGDVSNSGALSSFDAALIAQFAVNIASPASIAGTWRFIPASRNYGSVDTDLTGENYTAILMGEVSGNWTAPAPAAEFETKPAAPEGEPVLVDLPNQFAGQALTVLVPIHVGDVTGRGFISYDLEVGFDPAVIQPDAMNPVSTSGTVSSGLTVTPNTSVAGRIAVSAFGTLPLQGSGTLINLRFTIVGDPGEISPLTFEHFIFNEDQSASATNDGQIEVVAPTAAGVAVEGRVVTADGRGIMGARITLTESDGDVQTAVTNPFGYYRFESVEAGQLVTLSVASKRFVFSNPVLTVHVYDSVHNADFVADP